MKNILLINQHTCNHGDEAAGIALIREISTVSNRGQISVLYNTITSSEEDFIKNDSVSNHYQYERVEFLDKVIIFLCLLLPIQLTKILIKLRPVLRREYDLIRDHNYIISAPGGPNLGVYKDWRYLWRLDTAQKLRKKLIIYSISYGPLNDLGVFGRLARRVLQSTDFLSLRDAKSQRFGKQDGLAFIPSIDTAFLQNLPPVSLSSEIMLPSQYAVIVPNALFEWHPSFMKIPKKQFDQIYAEILSHFTANGQHVVLLPQMFGACNDEKYFREISSKIVNSNNNVTVIDDKYSSDIQQKIISNADFLIGSRYHTIIFAINNEKPFVCLSYEHKMTNTLELLGLSDHNLLWQDLLDCDLSEVSNKVEKILDRSMSSKDRREEAKSQAVKIANHTVDELKKFLR